LGNNDIYKPLYNSRAQGVSGKNEQPTQAPWRGQLHRLKADPVTRYYIAGVRSLFVIAGRITFIFVNYGYL